MEIELSVSTKMHFWWTWLRIATRHVGAAARGRAGEAKATSFEAASSAALSLEFESSLVAIASVAFAMEALDLELEGAGHILDKNAFVAPARVTRGYWVAQRLIQAFAFDGTYAAELPTKLDALFRLRHQGVHFESVTRQGVRPHPSGTMTAEEMTVFTLEASAEALSIGRDVLVKAKESVEDARHHPAAAAVARELPGVIGMLDEVIRSEGLDPFFPSDDQQES